MSAPTLNFSHSSELFDPKLARPVIQLGVGMVGSTLALMLPRLGVTDYTIWDDDFVASENLPMSVVFGLADQGRLKVDAVRDRIERDTGIIVKTASKKYTNEPLKGSVVSCVDKLEARMDIWRTVRSNPLVDVFVDTRTHEHFISVFTIRPTVQADIAFYEHHLYPSEQARRQLCGLHGTVYVACQAAVLAARALTLAWNGDIPDRHERVLFGERGAHLYTTREEA